MLQSLRIKLITFLIDLGEQFFERKLRKMYKSLLGNNINTVIDVGANKGQTIEFFKKGNRGCTIFSFEPNKDLYQMLLSKYKNDDSIKLFNMGVSDEIGEKEFHQNILHSTSSFEKLNINSSYLQTKAKVLGVKPEGLVTASYKVKTTTLSHFINGHIDGIIDVLKIDVEGHEYPCLVGLFSTSTKVNIRYIQLEQHNDDMYINKATFEDISKLLNDHGFEIKSTISHGFSNLDEVIFVNTKLEKQN